MVKIPFSQNSCDELASDAFFVYQMLSAICGDGETTKDRQKAIDAAFKIYCLFDASREYNKAG